ncbi:MAG: response regulator transcription factor [Bosea sp. (in: a-proteobacteria)]
MQLDGTTIALVEDDPIMGESLTQRLTIEGAKVTWWRTLTDAVSGLASCKPDVVICDIRLPDGSGEDVFRDVCAQERPPTFLFMTAYADIDQAVTLMKNGAGDYITKPFEMTTLLRRLQAMLLATGPQRSQAVDLKGARGAAERAIIERTLAETGGRIGHAAERLKVSRTTLWARMKALGINESDDVQKSEHQS